MIVLLLIISFSASAIGGLCGVGGGVIIKPVLDFLKVGTVSQISFMSACTVLAMTLFNVSKSMLRGSGELDVKKSTPLAVGAAVGGVLGSLLFSYLVNALNMQQQAGMYQAIVLAVLVLVTLIYNLNKSSVKTMNITNPAAGCGIGIVLGSLSSFLGIGGGPFNLAFLHFFYGMDTKQAALTSLYVILFSQITNLAQTVISGSVPDVAPLMFAFMIFGGISGGALASSLRDKLSGGVINKMFNLLMILVILISIYNAARYGGFIG